jgi:hypothetical protein
VKQPILARGNRAAASFAVAGLVLAALGVAGCSSQPDTPRASVESCAQFGMSAIRHHVTVIALPPACRGLTAAQVDLAAGTALRSAGSGVRGKTRQRERVLQASHFLVHMFVAVPAPRGESPLPAPATRLVSRATLGLAALGTWLATVALGLGLMARRVLRGRTRRRPAGRLRRPAALNLAHLGLAGASLRIWIVYLATAMTGLAWAAAVLLPLVAGLGMALLFLSYPATPAGSAAAQSLLSAQSAQALHNSARGRPTSVLTVGAHVIFATATILFAVLAAIGTG